jgi:hypothetical protein
MLDIFLVSKMFLKIVANGMTLWDGIGMHLTRILVLQHAPKIMGVFNCDVLHEMGS